jgi:hypothetical protein
MRLKITKVSGKEGSTLEPGFWVKGLTDPDFERPHEGCCLYLFAPIECQDERFDWFQTTPIVAMMDTSTGWVIYTTNSIWRVERL